MNRDGAMAIGQRVQELMERLEADPTMTEEFLNGDGALTITRTGITFTGFEDRPEPTFEPWPMNEDASAALHFADVKKRLVTFFERVEADPEASRRWLAAETAAIIDTTRFVMVERPIDDAP